MPLYDAHNHLQDARFAGRQEQLIREAMAVGVAGMVVNGSSEDDWHNVTQLAKALPIVRPSYGLHPWYHHQRTTSWLEQLENLLTRHPQAAVGEIGLDRWKEDLPYDEQEAVFLAQWELARRMNRPVSIHCLKAWGRLLELVQTHPGPERGFLLHSYGGPAEMITSFVQNGAYFSFPGYYLHPRKEKQRAVFRQIPIDRLLVESDAPDQRLPDDQNNFPLLDPRGHSINHPANLATVYTGLANLRGDSLDAMTTTIAQNFVHLFG
jgi:TatD DNase family protein